MKCLQLFVMQNGYSMTTNVNGTKWLTEPWQQISLGVIQQNSTKKCTTG